MINQQRKRRILRAQALGFFAIIGIAWLDVSLDLSQRIFGGDIHTTWQEGTLRTVGVLCVWTIVYLTTRSLLARLYHVEKFARLCSWCRKVGDDRGQWFSLEEHFAQHHNSDASHGLCPACEEKLRQHDSVSVDAGHTRA